MGLDAETSHRPTVSPMAHGKSWAFFVGGKETAVSPLKEMV